MRPIPVTFVYFNAQKQGQTTALLNWKTSQGIKSAYFDVERSSDAVNFTYIKRVNAFGNSQLPIDYSFTDNHPLETMNYYRWKQTDIDGDLIYTPSRLVRFDEADPESVKYYPNPTKRYTLYSTYQRSEKRSKAEKCYKCHGNCSNPVHVGSQQRSNAAG
ncbi:hypothetical protein BH11BAC4_BH11BAC4_20210 [soil metagenome]